MRKLLEIAPMLLVSAGWIVSTASAADLLPVLNANFEKVAVTCRDAYAYQARFGNCSNRDDPSQQFNGTPEIGWTFTQHYNNYSGTGITGPGTYFSPPPFDGLPFTEAAFLQGAPCEVSQTVIGFAKNTPYRLSFYLGARYLDDGADGDQTIVALIDDQVIGTWHLTSFTPFTLRNTIFEVIAGGPHILKFVGAASGDHTAFLSGVTVRIVDR